MGYYMRYFTTSTDPITCDQIAEALTKIDANYYIRPDQVDTNACELYYDDLLCAEIQLSQSDDTIFQEDLEDLTTFVRGSRHKGEPRVLAVLTDATQLIAVSVLWEGDDPNPTLTRIEPLWEILFQQYPGLLQIDTEGFYDENELIFPLRLKI
jgi:hypothetical protein